MWSMLGQQASSDAFFGYLDSDQLLQPGHETFDTDTGLDSFTGLVEPFVSQENMISATQLILLKWVRFF